MSHREPDRAPFFYRDEPEVEQRLLRDLGLADREALLRRGTPAAVKTAVGRLLEVMTHGGGFFLGPTHSFQDDVPTAQIVAMYEAVRGWFPR